MHQLAKPWKTNRKSMGFLPKKTIPTPRFGGSPQGSLPHDACGHPTRKKNRFCMGFVWEEIEFHPILNFNNLSKGSPEFVYMFLVILSVAFADVSTQMSTFTMFLFCICLGIHL